MHHITFTESVEDKKLFVVLWIGWNKGGELQGKEQNALGNSITQKLLGLANVNPASIGLRDEGGVLELTPREFRLLKSHCEAAPYPPNMSAEAVRMYETFETCQDAVT